MATLAFVGCSHIHTPGFVRMLKARPGFPTSNTVVKSVWDDDSRRAQYVVDTLGQGQVVRSASKIWKDGDITGVVICSHTKDHYKHVKAAAAAGKHVFVEKPLGINAKDSGKMAQMIIDAGIRFQTGYFNRGKAVHRFIQREIQAGRFGQITHVNASNCHSGALNDWFAQKPDQPEADWHWMAQPRESGCGAFGDLGTHMLDIMMWLGGDIESVAADIRPVINRYEDCDETGQAIVKFKSGATGALTAGWVSVANPVSLEVSGTKAHAAVVNGQLYYTCEAVPGADGKQPFAVDSSLEQPHAFELFLDAMIDKNVPLVPVNEAADRVAVMDAMYKASDKQKWITPTWYTR